MQLLLFALTLATTTIVGAENYAFFTIDYAQLAALIKQDDGALTALIWQRWSLLGGLWYSLTILGILGCHEMGHYLYCLRHNIIATRPYFLPLPPLGFTLTGTLGAFIRVKSRFPDKIALFDVGVAGPIAGFVVAVPALFLGIAMSKVQAVPPDLPFTIWLGEPLLFKFAQWAVWGTDRRRLLAQHASDGVRRVVRIDRDRAQSVSDFPAGRRAHFIRGVRPPLDRHHLRDDRRRRSG